MEKESGIYQIRNIINDKIYIGKSINLINRKSQHFLNLRKNTHKNFKLQGSVNKHGIDNFVFEILEKCDDIDTKEINYINKFNTCKTGYNISSAVQHMSEKWITKLKYLRKNDPKYIKQFKNCQEKSFESIRVKINEYDLNGNYVKTWNSIVEAQLYYNLKSAKSISMVLNFQRSRCVNKLFRYYNNDTFNIKPYQSFRKTKLKFINDTHELIFNSGIEAAEYFNISRSNISIRLKQGKYKNYTIRKI